MFKKHIIFQILNLHPLVRPSNGLGKCRKNSSMTALEVLAGGGWDNLRNIDMGRVMNLSYSQCQTTEDGVYLIPDEVFVIPQKVSGVETNSEIITSWLNQTSSTSSSINADVSFLSVLNGKYSEENRRMKTHQVKDNSVTSQVQVGQNHIAYFPVIPLNFFRNSYLIMAPMSSQVLMLVPLWCKRTISASAGLNFFDKVKFDISSKESQESSEIRGYQSNVAYSLMQSHGGALFYPGITLQKWEESPLNNLVAIDRSGLPIHYFLNPTTFPGLPVPTVNKMASSVRQAAEQYYEVNKRPGCINPDSQNFNFQANIDDASCEGPITNLSFGGIYQTSVLQTTCMSNDYEARTRFSVPFAGFFSCQSGNPLANGQNRCPPQFSQHLAAISDGCQILYCVQSGVFTGGQLKPVHLPPFTSPPLIGMIATNTVAVMTEGDYVWRRKGWCSCRVFILVALVVAGTVFLMKKRGSSGLRVINDDCYVHYYIQQQNTSVA
uniref:Macrophage-expressed gene 1 protein n=1 Tax=Sinocyclocheilus grahami TaxID=75366 RepID=A0A672LN19_SINGR